MLRPSRMNGRGDTLNLPLLTVRFSSPMPNVIRVQMVHHKGGGRADRSSSSSRSPRQLQIQRRCGGCHA